MIRHSLTALITLVFTSWVAGQNAPPSRVISLSIACFQYVDGVNNAKFQAAEGEGMIEIPFFQGGFTTPTKIKIQGKSVDFFLPREGTDGNTVMKKIAGATLPDDMRSASILLLPAPEGSNFVYNAVVMPRENEFPFGHVMMMNLTEAKVKFAIGKKVIEVTPKQVRFTDPKSSIDDFNMYPVAIAHQAPGSTEWLTMHTTRWQWNERVRQIAIAWYDTRNQKTEVSTMRDIQFVAPATAPSTDAPGAAPNL